MTLLEKEWFIEAPWGRICIVAFGDCTDPPVLVCHGSSDCIASFRPLISLLPQKFYYIGIFYSLSYPDKIDKMILLDTLSLAFSVSPENFPKWYKLSFTNYFEDYDKYSAWEEKPSYTQDEALNKIIKRRGLDSEMAQKILERCSKKLDNGHVRFTFDPRYKVSTFPPLTKEDQRNMFTSIKTSILFIVADTSKTKVFDPSSYLFDETSFPNKNYKVRVVEGTHDVHAIHPDRVAPLAAQFLLHGVTGLEGRSKL